MATVKENLIAAKALIDAPEKWVKGMPQPDKKKFCAMAAIGAVCNEWSGPRGALLAALPDRFVGGVMDFNDHPDTTHSDIMALFQRAIDAQDAP